MRTHFLVAAALLLPPLFPSRAQDYDISAPTISANSTFVIKQTSGDELWTSVLHFNNDEGRADITLSSDYAWPAQYLIAPNEKWILQIQKTSSGQNTGILRRMDTESRAWRLEQPLDELALHWLKQNEKLNPDDYFHTGINFREWTGGENPSGIRFEFHAAPSSSSANKPISREFLYDFKKGTLTPPKK